MMFRLSALSLPCIGSLNHTDLVPPGTMSHVAEQPGTYFFFTSLCFTTAVQSLLLFATNDVNWEGVIGWLILTP